MFELPPSSVGFWGFTLKYPEVIIGGCAIFLKNRFAERHLFLAVCFFARFSKRWVFEGKVRSPCWFTILIEGKIPNWNSGWHSVSCHEVVLPKKIANKNLETIYRYSAGNDHISHQVKRKIIFRNAFKKGICDRSQEGVFLKNPGMS